jgi:hypothetical protein
MNIIENTIRVLLNAMLMKQGSARKKVNSEELEDAVIQQLGSFETYREAGGYKTFYSVFQRLVGEFNLLPFSTTSESNGKSPSLEKNWWLTPKFKDNQWSFETIANLSNVLNIDFFLRNKKYQTTEELDKVILLYNYLSAHPTLQTVSREERSLMVFNENRPLTKGEPEKYLSSPEGKQLLKRLKLDGIKLGFEVVKEPFIYWENLNAPHFHRNEVLIVEGLSTFHTLKHIFQRNIALALGPIPSLLIWGAGHRIESTIDYLEDIKGAPEDLSIRYAGDIDYTGFEIYYNLVQKNKHLSIRFAIEYYAFLCSFGLDNAHPIKKEQIKRDKLLPYIRHDFQHHPETLNVLEHLWHERLRIPQELLNIETLFEKGCLSL